MDKKLGYCIADIIDKALNLMIWWSLCDWSKFKLVKTHYMQYVTGFVKKGLIRAIINI